MHDLLFATQGNSDATNLTLHARTLGLDVEKFTACIEGGKHEENIRRGVAGAKRAGVYGTPAFLIGTTAGDGDVIRTHNVLVGGESYEAIKSAIEEALKAQETILPGK
jgi:predicted DsbA family dithiol-disulfide isomerase